jgi:hypothetical protein
VLPDVNVAHLPMASAVKISAGQEPPLVVALTSLPTPFSGVDVGHFMFDLHLDEALKDLDPAHRLAELTSSWMALSTSFGEKLQVISPHHLVFLVFWSFVSPHPSFLF